MRVAIIVILAFAGFLGLSTDPSYAQATRTWVSGLGDDANPCSRTAPCKTLPGAMSKTAAGGEINILDPGGFGPVSINKSLTIRTDHVETGILAGGTNGVTVLGGAGDTVVLEGLDIDGQVSGLAGISFVSGKSLTIIRCLIRNFSQNGVNVRSSTSGARALIQDSVITNNGDASHGGVNVEGSGSSTNALSVVRTTVDGNVAFAARASGTGNTIGVAHSVLTGSPVSLKLENGATGVSFGPSNVTSPTAAFTTTNPFK